MAGSTEAARLYTTVGADIGGLRVGAREAESLTSRLAKRMAIYATLAGTAWGSINIAKSVGREVVNVDLGLRKTNSLFGLTGQKGQQSFEMLQSGVQRLSTQIGVAQSTLTDGLYQAISSGVPRQNAFDFMRVASKAAIAGVTDTETSVDALSTVLNSFKDQNLQVTQAADDMFQAVNIGKVEFPELAQYVGQAASFVDTAGVSFKDFMAALATMTSKGVHARIAITEIKQAMVQMMKPTDQLQKAFHSMGVNTWDQLLKRSGSLQGAFLRIRSAAGGSKEKLMEMAGSVDAANAILTLTGPNARDAAGALRTMRKDAGAMGKAFGEVNKSVSRQWEQLKVRVTNFGVTFANQFLPQILSGLSELSSGMEHALNDPNVQQGIVNLANGLMNFVSVIGQVGGFVLSNAHAFEALAIGMIASSAAGATMAATFGVLESETLALYAGIGSLGEAMFYLNALMASNPIGMFAIAAGIAASALFIFRSGADSTATSVKNLNGTVQSLAHALDDLTGSNLSAKQAQLDVTMATVQATAARRAANDAIHKYGRNSQQARAAVLASRQADLQLAQARHRLTVATHENSETIAKNKREYEKLQRQVGKAAEKYLEQKQYVDRLRGEYGKNDPVYKNEKKKLDQLSDSLRQAQSRMADMETQIGSVGSTIATNQPALKKYVETIKSLRSKTVTLTIHQDTISRMIAAGPNPKVNMDGTVDHDGNPFTGKGKRRGGLISGPGSGTSDSVPIMASNGEFMSTAASTRRNEAALAAGNRGARLIAIPGFAKGGRIGHKVSPVERADAAWQKIQSRWQLREANVDLAMARAEGTKSTADDKRASAQMRALYRQEAKAFRSFLRHHPGALSVDTHTQILQAIANAERQSYPDRSADMMTPTTGEAGPLFARQTGSASSGGGTDGTVLGGDANGVGYVPDSDSHPVFFDGQQINSLTFNSSGGVGVLITGILGWDDAEVTRMLYDERSGQDGEVPRELLVGGAPLTIKGIIGGSSKADLESRWRSLRSILQPAHGSSEVVLKLPDPTYTGSILTTFAATMSNYVRRYCRVVGTVKRGNQIGKYSHEFTVELRSSDPRRYNDVSQTNQTSSIATGGGRTYPKSYSKSYGSAFTGGTVDLVNGGNYETNAVLKISGPVTNPIVEDISGRGAIYTSGLDIASSDTLYIDLFNHLVYLNGDLSQNRFQYVDFTQSTWWMIPEGSSTLRLRGSVISDPASMSVTFSDAWL